MHAQGMRTMLLVALALCLSVLAPAASAHTAIFSADDRVRGSAGLLNEPTSTYAVTGLDLCFTHNNTARAPITGTPLNPGALTVVLKAPSGATHTSPLSVPFGRANCVVFETPLVLTEPGQYLLDISGDINGTSFSEMNVKAGGPVRDRANITFPADGVIADHEAQDRIESLESELAQLRTRVQTLEAGHEEDESNGIPAPTGIYLMLGLVALAAVLRRR